MSAFNAFYYSDAVVIVMDTLAIVNDTPFKFTSKMYPILHLKGVICGTGIGSFIQDWAQRVNTGMLARDMIHLDEFTPNSLRQLAAEKYGTFKEIGTVYHFGYSDTENIYKGFAYRSTNDFNSEPFQGYGTILKPPTDYSMPEDEIDLVKAIAELAKVVVQQKKEQDKLPSDERVFIGGEIQYTVLQNGDIQMGTCYRFPDWDDLYNRMCDALPANQE